MVASSPQRAPASTDAKGEQRHERKRAAFPSLPKASSWQHTGGYERSIDLMLGHRVVVVDRQMTFKTSASGCKSREEHKDVKLRADP